MERLIETLILDFVDWIIERERAHRPVMSAWRESHPELPLWEEANHRGLVRTELVNRRRVIRPTSLGLILSELRRESKKRVRQPQLSVTNAAGCPNDKVKMADPSESAEYISCLGPLWYSPHLRKL